MNHLYTVDAFTSEVHKGNPAGVMLTDQWPAELKMQAIAAELNLSETAFVDLSVSPHPIKFYTPSLEIDLCGHATLASAHLLFELGMVDKAESIEFTSNVGVLTCTYSDGWINMNLPAYEVTPASTIFPFSSAMSIAPIKIYKSSNNWIIAELANEQEVSSCKPNHQAMVDGGLGFSIVTAPADAIDTDFVCRVFAPQAGVDEDPVTGSAQCVLAPLWAGKLNKSDLTARQVSNRSGEIKAKILDNDRVLVSGQAVTVFKLTTIN